MSIISHLLVVVFLSFLFCHGSSARCFGLINNQLPKRLHLLSKTMTEEKLKHYRASTSSVPEEESIKISDKKHEEKARKEAHHHHDHEKKKKMGNKNGEKDGAVSSSVTWKVREKKRGEPQAEFNLDYLPARTHPPVHN
ncbi:PREDICTED: uncharacterized protein LOC109183454 isoform X2 [Ipomoea nil]|uniref:uncharacterized protein LOC109183454 isoform X2 n=1 Tax=Ipomoea nil TaxID=35883 RepID=UPI000901B748|nr:PREDICTED: uncharacterized protein LOC109183454 isoform X2 [Ipomoea nil]